MARSSWKYHFYKTEDIENYINYLTDSSVYNNLTSRVATITKLNFFRQGLIYTGKYEVLKNFSRYHIGFKVGAFTKNRKPFYFRSKKKKNVTKKYKL